MAKNTKIEWATATWSPFIGCTKVSPACDNCYAERWAKRCGRTFSKVIRAAAGTFYSPMRWKQPERIFVCALSDFFHPDISREDRLDAISVMVNAPQHTYMLLTKRPENIWEQLSGTEWEAGLPDNVWVGVTAENQEQADKRIPLLLQVPAKVRFVSCEPLLGPIRFRAEYGNAVYDWLAGEVSRPGGPRYIAERLFWVICGGESGPQARPMHPDWARSLRDQCAAASVPFMFKQWGEWYPDNKGIYENVRSAIMGDATVHRVGKGNAGRILDGREHLEIPA